MRLTCVTLGARNLPALRRFYLGLGWKEVEGSDDGWAAFLLGGVVLALYPEDALDAEASSPGHGRGGFTLIMNVDEKVGVDSTFSDMVGAGARPLAQPQERSWGGRSAYVADLEGNRWEIAWAPGLRLGERGEVLEFGS
jgi:catechol 2,3-dioxygenase-like lactoylglutathione lyase family enzyme